MKMAHVTIQTKYFEEEIKFYQEMVGLSIQGRMQGIGRNIVFLAGAEDDTKIEIIEKADADNSGNQYLSLGYKTSDVARKREELLSQGYQVSEMVSPTPEVQFFFAKDPAGVTVQFM